MAIPQPDGQHRRITPRPRMRSMDVEDYFDFQRSSTESLPDPRVLLENLSRSVIEILMGVREVEQIARWVTESTYHHLLRRSIAARRARAVRKQAAVRTAFHIGSVVVCHPADGIVEGTVIIRSPGRTRAVAMRLEGLDGRWRATAIHVL